MRAVLKFPMMQQEPGVLEKSTKEEKLPKIFSKFLTILAS
jgi:hypothetical protein